MFEVNNVQENGEKGSFSSRTAYLRSVWVLISHLPITILVMFICIVNYISDLVRPVGAIQVYSCQRSGNLPLPHCYYAAHCLLTVCLLFKSLVDKAIVVCWNTGNNS